MALSIDKEAAEERVAARNEEIAQLQTQIAEREANMPLRERVCEIFKKYDMAVASIFIAAGVTIGGRGGGGYWGNHQRFEIHGQTIGKWS